MWRLKDKWRPSISLVVLAILATVMALPLLGLFCFQLYQERFAPAAEPAMFSHGAVAAAALVIGVTLLIAFVFIRTITRPMHDLMERTIRIAEGETRAIRPLAHHGTREMAELSRAFLDMARKLQIRNETIRTFATHVSHELKSPLTAIQGAAELLRDASDQMDPATKTRFLDNIVADTDRLNRLVRRLIELARADNPALSGQSTSLAEIFDHLAPVDGVDISVASGADTRIAISPENGAAILSNLVDNSLHHGASHFVVEASSSNGMVTIAAIDDGHGVSPNNRDRIFEPFFTTRRESGGTGLGLGIVTALLSAHDGTIRLSSADKGARFEIRLPAA
ncbi:ATP-binding protein [Aminobacter sp. UC22_36]|uniref:HAMP domain-containing sensor histidine kinase n=1 Tax=Aminobacter sp. UC22_36 TaxID=3374549 RepID=UPI00375804E9